MGGHFLLERGRILLSVLVKIVACFRGNGETCRDRQADLGHFGEPGSFATEQITPLAVAF